MKKIILCASLMAFPFFSQSATLYISGGQLIGAFDVSVNGALYDVEFRDGTCFDLFQGCDETADFIFNTQEESRAAAEGLLDQVFIDDILPLDSVPSLISGCSDLNFCAPMIPFADNDGQMVSWAAFNSINESEDGPGTEGRLRFDDTYFEPTAVYAIFTTAVPIPTAAWLFLSAIGGLIGIKRRLA